jgi:hypothetical protein
MGDLFNLIKGMQMVQNKKLVAGMALIVGLVGMGTSSAALALPEMDVDTAPPIVAPQSVNPIDSIAADTQADAS